MAAIRVKIKRVIILRQKCLVQGFIITVAVVDSEGS